MRRRQFITLLGGAAAAPSFLWPLAARAQQPERIRRIGILLGYSENDSVAQSRVAAFREALAKLGWNEGRIHSDIRWSGTDPERMRADAIDLVARSPDIIMSSPAQVVLILQKVVQAIPIVFVNVPDPVAIGLVQSLAQPGGNSTGFTNFEHELAGKWLEGLKEITPRAVRIGVVYSPENPAWQGRLRVMEASAASLSVRLSLAATRDTAEIERVFDAFARDLVDGVVVFPSIFAAAHRKRSLKLLPDIACRLFIHSATSLWRVA